MLARIGAGGKSRALGVVVQFEDFIATRSVSEFRSTGMFIRMPA